jgi:hypothetical protein
MGFLAEAFEGITTTVESGDYAQASGAAVHSIVLGIRRE